MGFNSKDNKFYFNNYVEFSLFAKINGRHLRDQNDGPDLKKEVLAMQILLEISFKAADAATGGCGCNAKKRRNWAIEKYKEAIEGLAGSSVALTRLKARAHNPEKFVFRLMGVNEEVFMEL